MDLYVIFGPSAVGKATVGKALAAATGYKLFHNHMVIDLVYKLFDFGEGPFWDLVKDFRRKIFRALRAAGDPKSEFAKGSHSDEQSRAQVPGVIFTYVWSFDSDEDYQELCSYLRDLGVEPSKVKYVELYAQQNVRLRRNRQPSRTGGKT
jgi:hypothetical protein